MNDHEGSEHGQWIRAALERYERPLLRYAAQVIGDHESARDVVQDTFLRLCRQRREQVDGHLAQWLYTVCRNRSLDVRRKETRMKSMSTQEVTSQTSRDKDHVSVAEDRDAAERVRRIVGGLTENQREVVRLKFEHGLTYREISKVTSLSISNVGYLIHKALEKVRSELRVQLDSSAK